MSTGIDDTRDDDDIHHSGSTDKHKEKKSRGIVKMDNISELRRRGKKGEVLWSRKGVPYGSGRSNFAHFIGLSARHIVPINIRSWLQKDLFPLKEKVWNIVKVTYDLSETHKKWVLQEAARLHRNKLRIKAKKATGTLSSEPPSEYISQSSVTSFWSDFVELSEIEDFQEESTKNRDRGLLVEARYRGGSTSLQDIEEKIMKRKIKDGEKDPVVSRYDLFVESRTKQTDGVIEVPDPKVQSIIEQAAVIRESMTAEEEKMVGPNDLFARVVKPDGKRVRGLGYGVTRKVAFSKDPEVEDAPQIVQLSKEVMDLKKEILMLKAGQVRVHAPMPEEISDIEEQIDIDNIPPGGKGKTNEVGSSQGSNTKPYYPHKDDADDLVCWQFIEFYVKNMDATKNVVIHMSSAYFVDEYEDHIAKENITEVTEHDRLSASCLSLYMRYLCEAYICDDTMKESFSFVTPHISNVKEASNHIARALRRHEGEDHLIMLPYNIGEHWILLGIHTGSEQVFYLDPLRTKHTHSSRNGIKDIITRALLLYRMEKRNGVTSSKLLKGSTTWVTIECPKQTNNIDCGYYVMLFIEDILQNGSTKIPIEYPLIARKDTYSPSDIMRFQHRWAGYLWNRFLKTSSTNDNI